jgi:24-methylenesterol C-methyltransferase
MRMVAALTGASVTGVTINAYQVERANALNARFGLSHLATAVRANFLDLPFPDASFDAAYAVEATCHAPVLADVYAQIWRVLRPGGVFVCVEWLSTPAFQPGHARHEAILAAIAYGNGLPSVRSPAEALEAARNAGFEVELEYDIASAPGAPPASWVTRLAQMRRSRAMGLNAAIVRVLAFLRLAPEGLVPVHDMLVAGADALIAGGEAGIFTPMHLLVLRKPKSVEKNSVEGGAGAGRPGRLFGGLAAGGRAKKA